MKPLFLLVLFSVTLVQAQPVKSVNARRIYTMSVEERDPVQQDNFSEKLRGELNLRESRGFGASVFASYRSAASSVLGDMAFRMVGVAVQHAVSALKGHHDQWEKTIRKECTFKKDLKMLAEIHHFYNENSIVGPMDPSGMVFDGFSCRQDIMIDDEIVNVFNLVCKVRTDSIGLQSIVSDSRFLIYVDEVSFNPYLCDLPNDSLDNASLRIPFDFERRKDLKLHLSASITSTWMNQILQIFRDQELGRFEVEVRIDPRRIVTDESGAKVFHYKYSPGNPDNSLVSVSGDSFIVPRSYVASKADSDVWGMGQYKVNMCLYETCSINEDYYKEDGKWDKDKWNPEWQVIKQRPKTSGFLSDMSDAVTQDFKNGQWMVKTITPFTSVLINEGTTFISGKK